MHQVPSEGSQNQLLPWRHLVHARLLPDEVQLGPAGHSIFFLGRFHRWESGRSVGQSRQLLHQTRQKNRGHGYARTGSQILRKQLENLAEPDVHQLAEQKVLEVSDGHWKTDPTQPPTTHWRGYFKESQLDLPLQCELSRKTLSLVSVFLLTGH